MRGDCCEKGRGIALVVAYHLCVDKLSLHVVEADDENDQFLVSKSSIV